MGADGGLAVGGIFELISDVLIFFWTQKLAVGGIFAEKWDLMYYSLETLLGPKPTHSNYSTTLPRQVGFILREL